MAVEYLAAFGMSPWGPMALAFLFGVAFGWVMWGVKSAGTIDDAGAAAPLTPREGEPPKELVVLKAEIDAVRNLFGEIDETEGDIANQLVSLDETVKRANGRLKTIVAAVKRAAGSGDR